VCALVGVVSAPHTAGPWRWELNEQHKLVHLVGGKPQFDLTILEPIRWGMGRAGLMIRDTAHDGMNIMHKLHERRDWIAPFPGRSHHANWCADVTHPDMRLIAAAPDQHAVCLELDRLMLVIESAVRHSDPRNHAAVMALILANKAAIAKATGAAS
jgi:hypothetical protein